MEISTLRVPLGLVIGSIGLSGCDQVSIFDSAPVAACTRYAKARAISGPSFKRVGVEEWDETITEKELGELRPKPVIERLGNPGLHFVGISYEDLNPQGIPIDGLAQICAFETRDGKLSSSSIIESNARMAESTARMRDLAEMGLLPDAPESVPTDLPKYPCCL